MPDDPQKLEIGIATTYDGKGAKEAAGDLDALGAATKKTGANQYDLEADLGKVEKRVEGVSGQSREMYRIFSELDRVVPGLGEGLRGLITGPLGMIGALVFGLYEAKGAWDKYNEGLDEAAKRADQPLDGGIKTIQTAWDQATTELGKYFAALATGGQDKDPIGEQIKRQKELDDAIFAGIQKNIEALGKEREAAILANDARQGKSKEETAADLLAARVQTQASLDGLEDSRQQKSTKYLQQELEQRKAAQASLDEKAQSAIKAQEQADAEAKQRETELANLREANAPDATKSKVGLTTQADVEGAQKALEHEKTWQNLAVDTGLQRRDETQWIIDLRQRDLDKVKAALEGQQKREQELESGEIPEKIKQSTATDEATRAIAAGEQNKSRINELPGEITQAQSLAGIKTDLDTTATKIDALTQIIKTTGAPGQIIESGAKALGVESHLQTGQKLAGDQATSIENLGTLLTTIGWNQEQVLNILGKHADSQQYVLRLINAANARIDQINTIAMRAAQSANSPY